MFPNRESAGRQLAKKLKGGKFRDPLVLAIPRGGVVLGAVLARDLEADLDVILSRKLRAPGSPELAMGAISEKGQIYLNPEAEEMAGLLADYVTQERHQQMAEIERSRGLFRKVRPAAPLLDRSIIVTDDGIATGSTMIAALRVVKQAQPHEVIVAVPVGAPDRLEEVERWCDELVCLDRPKEFWAIGEFYQDFSQVGDAAVEALLRAAAARPRDPDSFTS